MKCHFINLDAATERRATLEANFARCGRPDWTLHRFSALDEATVQELGVPGTRSWREKGCFLSHKSLIEEQADDGQPFMVLEDDAQLGLSSLEIIQGVVDSNADAQWDLLFTDLSVVPMETMITLALNRDELLKRRMVLPLDLARISFVGATAYVVHGASRRKLLAYLDAGMPVDIEYDLYLRNGIASGQLRAAVLFPFVTTLSRHSAASQVQPPETSIANLARDTFRRMMWLESSPESYSADLALVESAAQDTLCGRVAMLAGAQYLTDPT